MKNRPFPPERHLLSDGKRLEPANERIAYFTCRVNVVSWVPMFYRILICKFIVMGLSFILRRYVCQKII